MTQKPNSTQTSPSLLSQRLIMQGLGWLGGLSLLSGGMGFAQTPASTDIPAVPSAQDLLAPAPAASAPAAPARVAPAPAVSTPPSPSVEFSSPSPAASTPAARRPTASPAAEAPISLPSSVAGQVETLTPHQDNYIDTTDYSLGATPSYGQPSSVVLSERSTGCQTVLHQGQGVPASICSAQAQTGSGRPGGVNSINIGPVSLGANGINVGRSLYNLTPRPMAFAGNGNTRLMFPLSIPVAITSAFGWRVHPITGALRFHYGTDLGAPMGTPVLAAYTGRVAIADYMQGYGLAVVLRHNSPNAQTLYGHMSEIFVRPGEWIEQGQVIGRVGSTGNSTGPHLHFEFREYTDQGWVALNPGGLLQQAIAQFSKPFQTAQAKPAQSEVTLISFGSNSVKGLLKVFKEDIQKQTSLQNDKLQRVKFGEGTIVFGLNTDSIKVTKDWNHIGKKLESSLALNKQSALSKKTVER